MLSVLKCGFIFAVLSVGFTYGLVYQHPHNDSPIYTKAAASFDDKSAASFDDWFDQNPSTTAFQVKHHDQLLDHFNFRSQGQHTYSQRYLINVDYWGGNAAPIFFYTGNEGDIMSFKNASGFVTSFGEEAKAMIVFAEHRYYGTSLPFGEDSFDGDNIGLLTMEQALADFATLMLHLKEKYAAHDSPIITFGGSYGGQLAAYMRIRYPNIVTGALAASAPLNWITNKGDSHGFWQSVTSTFSKYVGCEDVVRIGFGQVERLASMKKFDEIQSTFGLCSPLTDDNLPHFMGWVRNAFTDLAMMNYPYKTSFLAPLPGHPVQVACERATNATGGDMSGLAQISSLYYGGGDTDACFDMMTQYVQCSDPTGCGLGNDAKAWDYQACTEIILPGGTNGKTDMFPVIKFTPEMRSEYCNNKYGVVPRLDWIRMSFWTDALSQASKIIFSNGDLDPWGPGGINTQLSPSLPVVKVVGGAHHLDLRGPNDADPQSVKEAREAEKKYIREWIGK